MIQIDTLALQSSQACFDRFTNVLGGKILNRFSRCPRNPNLCCNHTIFAGQTFPKQFFAVSVSVNVGGIEEIYAEVISAINRRLRFIVINDTPADRYSEDIDGTAQCPGSKSHFRNPDAGIPDQSIFHKKGIIIVCFLRKFSHT